MILSPCSQPIVQTAHLLTLTSFFDALHQTVQVIDYFQQPALVVAFLQRLVTHLNHFCIFKKN